MEAPLQAPVRQTIVGGRRCCSSSRALLVGNISFIWSNSFPYISVFYVLAVAIQFNREMCTHQYWWLIQYCLIKFPIVTTTDQTNNLLLIINKDVNC